MKFKILVGIVPVYQEKLLIIQRSHTSHYLPGQWTFICGHLNYGEKLEDAVHRELKEEVSLTGEISDLIGTNEWTWQEQRVHYLQVNYKVKLSSSDVKLDASCEEYKWISPENEVDNLVLDEFNTRMFNQYINRVSLV